jgi:cation transport ATPase
MTQTFTVTGMTCGNCVSKVQARLNEHQDVAKADVLLDPPKAHLEVHHALSEEDINKWLAGVGKYRVTAGGRDHAAHSAAPPVPEKNATTYKPLIILLVYLVLGSMMAAAPHDIMGLMHYFMAGFFLAFSFFKMLDLRGFADAYRSYDLIAKAVPAYGFVYPFLELGLGLAYLDPGDVSPVFVYGFTVLLMAVSLAGVLKAVLSKTAIRCACLGTVFNLPMSTVTIIEDGLMLAMAVVMLVIG